MTRYLDFDKKYTTNRVQEEPTVIMQDGIESVIPMKHRIKSIPLGELIKEYYETLSSKPKRFVYGIFPNGSYKYEMLDWTMQEEKLRKLLNKLCSVEWLF